MESDASKIQKAVYLIESAHSHTKTRGKTMNNTPIRAMSEDEVREYINSLEAARSYFLSSQKEYIIYSRMIRQIQQILTRTGEK